jgi:uncharacterized protein (DUF58 family)
VDVAVGLIIGILAVLVAGAGWRLGATGRGLVLLAVAAGLGVGGRVAGVEEYVLLAVALGVLLAAGPIVLWHRAERAVGTLRIDLRPSSHEISVGGSAQLLVTVTNTGPRPCAPMRLECPDEEWQLSRPGFRSRPADGHALEDSRPARQGRSPRWRRRFVRGARVPALGIGESAQLEFEIPGDRRGVLTLPSLKLWCVDPFELFAYEMVVATETSILVVPDPTPPSAVIRGVLQPAGRIEWSPPVSGEATGGQGFDLSGLRPYVPGDRLRLLHWPTLARTGELVVRDFEGSGTDAVTVVMDDRAGTLDVAGFEAIVSATAGIGLEAARLGLGLELRTPGGVSLDIQAGSSLSKSILRVLATLDPIQSRTGRKSTPSFELVSPQGHAVTGDKHRILVSTVAAVETLPDLLRRSSTLVLV